MSSMFVLIIHMAFGVNARTLDESFVASAESYTQGESIRRSFSGGRIKLGLSRSHTPNVCFHLPSLYCTMACTSLHPKCSDSAACWVSHNLRASSAAFLAWGTVRWYLLWALIASPLMSCVMSNTITWTSEKVLWLLQKEKSRLQDLLCIYSLYPKWITRWRWYYNHICMSASFIIFTDWFSIIRGEVLLLVICIWEASCRVSIIHVLPTSCSRQCKQTQMTDKSSHEAS